MVMRMIYEENFDQVALQRGVAVFLVLMSLFIVGREGLTIINPTSDGSVGVVSPGGTPDED